MSILSLLSLVPFHPFPPSYTHHTALLTSPPIICPSNVSQAGGKTALRNAILYDQQGIDGCAECVAVLRAAGACAASAGQCDKCPH